MSIASLFIGRPFCGWMALFIVIDHKLQTILKLPALRLVADEENCNSCALCNKHCPMSLNVEELVYKESMENSECILGGICADICKKKVTGYYIFNSAFSPAIVSRHR